MFMRAFFQGFKQCRTNFGSVNSVVTQIRFVSQTPISITTTQINKQLTLRTINRTSLSDTEGPPIEPDEEKPVVILFEWIYAKPSAVEKYCNLYHSQGMDVLSVRGKLNHFLWPPKGYEFADQLLDYILDKKGDFIVHAFSLGAYIFTLMLKRADQIPEKYGAFRERVKGQIFDSITLGSYDHMSNGIVYLVPGSEKMKRPILELMDVYYSMTKRTTRDEYDLLVEHFKAKPILVPTLLYYCHDDPMCDLESMENMIHRWHTEIPTLDLRISSWESSVHTAHLKFHEQDYVESLTKLLCDVNHKD